MASFCLREDTSFLNVAIPVNQTMTKELLLKKLRWKNFVFVLPGSMIPPITELRFIALIDGEVLPTLYAMGKDVLASETMKQ